MAALTVLSGPICVAHAAQQSRSRAVRASSALSARHSAGGISLTQQRASGARRQVHRRDARPVRAALAEPPALPALPVEVESVLDPEDFNIWPPEKVKGRPRIIVLGSGWAAVAFIKNLDPAHYAAALISPRNYFLCVPSRQTTPVFSAPVRLPWAVTGSSRN